MLKKITLTNLFTVAFAVALLFMNTEVGAASRQCVGSNASGSKMFQATAGPDLTTLVPGDIASNFPIISTDPLVCGGLSSCAIWQVELHYTGINPSLAFWTVPADVSILGVTSSSTVHPPGEGSSATGFAVGVLELQLVEFTSNGVTFLGEVITPPGLGPTDTTVAVKAGGFFETCDILGAATALQTSGVFVSNTQCVTLDARASLLVNKGPDGCSVIDTKFFLDNPECNKPPEDPDSIPRPTSSQFLGDSTCSALSSSCNECMRKTKNSPVTFEYEKPDGTMETFCYDLANTPSFSCVP